MSSLDKLKSLIQDGKFTLPENENEFLSRGTIQTMENSKPQSLQEVKPGFMSRVLKTTGMLLMPAGTVGKAMLLIGGAAIAGNLIMTLADDYKTEKANPAHYSMSIGGTIANKIFGVNSGFGDFTGDKDAATSQDYQKNWVDHNIKPLHELVKKEATQEYFKALEDGKFSENERVNLENKITELHQKFFGNPMPEAGAEPLPEYRSAKPKP